MHIPLPLPRAPELPARREHLSLTNHHQIAAFCGDETHYACHAVCYHGEHGELVATNGYALVVVPCEKSSGPALLIPGEALARLERATGFTDVAVTAGECGQIELRESGVTVSVPQAEGKFPDWRNAAPSGDPASEVLVDARLLHRICEHAMRCCEDRPVLRVKCYGREQPLVITAHDGRGDRPMVAKYLLMPLVFYGDTT